MAKQKAQRLAVFPTIIESIQNNDPPIYFLDETVFSTRQSVELKVWSLPGAVAPAVKRNKVSFPAVAAVAVIDVAGNIVACETRPMSFKTESYVEFLKLFRSLTVGPVKLMVDNLSCHHSKLALDYCK